MLYMRSDPRVTTSNHINQAPVLPPRHASASIAVKGPSRIIPQTGPPTQYDAAAGGLVFVPRDWRGGWDALGGRLMQVPQSDMIDTSRPVESGYSPSGIYDTPNAAISIEFQQLNMTTSARMGAVIPAAAPWPTMFYQPPPSYSQQTIPVIAVGL